MSSMSTTLQLSARTADSTREKHSAVEGTAGSRSTSAGSSSLHSTSQEASQELKSFSNPFHEATGFGHLESEQHSPVEVKHSLVSQIGLPPGLEEFALASGAAGTMQEVSTTVAPGGSDAQEEDNASARDTPSPRGISQQPPLHELLFMPPPPLQGMLPPPPQQAPVVRAPLEEILVPPPPVLDSLLPAPPQQPPALSLHQMEAVPPPPAVAPVLRLTDSLPEPAMPSFRAQLPIVPPPPAAAPVLRLTQSFEPAAPSHELPTVGSSGHRVGACKPCAFFHAKGCSNGTQCLFCHLCPPGEKKRRLKETRAVQRKVTSSLLAAVPERNIATALK